MATPEEEAARKAAEADAKAKADEEARVAEEARAKADADAKASEDARKAAEKEAKKTSTKKFEVGDRVSYPHKESDGERRVGEVVSVDGDIAEVTYFDGTTKSFGVAQLKKAN